MGVSAVIGVRGNRRIVIGTRRKLYGGRYFGLIVGSLYYAFFEEALRIIDYRMYGKKGYAREYQQQRKYYADRCERSLIAGALSVFFYFLKCIFHFYYVSHYLALMRQFPEKEPKPCDFIDFITRTCVYQCFSRRVLLEAALILNVWC